MPWITVNTEEPKPTTFEDLGYVQVVRCKDCKWWKNGLCKSDDVSRKIYDCGCYPDFRTDSYWFCADGERR